MNETTETTWTKPVVANFMNDYVLKVESPFDSSYMQSLIICYGSRYDTIEQTIDALLFNYSENTVKLAQMLMEFIKNQK